MSSVSSKNPTIQYQIQFDSQSKNIYQIKSEIIDVYRNMIQNIHSDSYSVMVGNNLSQFEVVDQTNVSYQNGILKLTIGDGKGSYISGDFNEYECVAKVKPKSFIQELFQ